MEDRVEKKKERGRENPDALFNIEPIIPAFLYSITPIVSEANQVPHAPCYIICQFMFLNTS